MPIRLLDANCTCMQLRLIFNHNSMPTCLPPLYPVGGGKKNEKKKKEKMLKNLFHAPCKGLRIQSTPATLNWVLLVSRSGCIYKQRKLNIQACHVGDRCWLSAIFTVVCVVVWLSGLVGQLEPMH